MIAALYAELQSMSVVFKALRGWSAGFDQTVREEVRQKDLGSRVG